MFSCCRQSDHCGGGILVYVKNEHKVSARDVIKQSSSFVMLKGFQFA